MIINNYILKEFLQIKSKDHQRIIFHRILILMVLITQAFNKSENLAKILLTIKLKTDKTKSQSIANGKKSKMPKVKES